MYLIRFAMKKVITLFIMLLAAMLPARAERTVIFEGDGDVHLTVIPLPITHDGVTLSIYGTVHIEGLFMYGGYQSSVTTAVGKITSIVFERKGSVSFSFSEGSYNTDGNNGYWTGSATSVTFVPSADVVVYRIIVTVDDSGCQSDVSLCDLQLLQGGEAFLSSRELVVLRQARYFLFVKDRLTDCYGLVNGDVGQFYSQGDVIPAGWGGSMVPYDGEHRLMGVIGFKPAEENVEVEPDEITPNDVGHDYWAHYVVLRNVMISEDGSVAVDEDGNEAPLYKWIYGVEPPALPDDLSVPYNVYGIVESFSSGHGSSSVISYKILPIRYESVGSIETVCSMQDLLELYPQNQPVQFSCPLVVIYQNGNYLYFKDTCNRYGLMYGNKVGGPYENGDTIIGTAFWTTYQQAPQLGVNDEWRLVGHGPAVQPLPAAIDEMSEDCIHAYVRFDDVDIIEEGNNTYIEDRWGNRLLVYNRFQVDLHPASPMDGGAQPCIYEEITISTVLNMIEQIASGNYEYLTRWVRTDGYSGELTNDVTGFLSMYNGVLELFPTEVGFHGWTKKRVLKWDATDDGELNIADVNAIIDLILYE